MASQIALDVVKEEQLVGTPVPISENATPTNSSAASGTGLEPTQNVFQNKVSTSTIGSDALLEDKVLEEEKALESTTSGTNDQVEPGPVSSVEALSHVDLSGGSDTEISVLEGSDASKEQTGHVRSNSFKKPTSFKSVSITKSFLAKSAVGAPTVKGLNDSRGLTPSGPGSTGQGPARPRLVAKSGSSGLAPRSSSTANGVNGPDASKVWNKNRPVAPPPPKQFTDEELKQQYGIHMATRLQTDENSKESKWADIDDDEDDWAPETVQWMDGTKSSIVPSEQTPAATPIEEAKPLQAPRIQQTQQTQPTTQTPPAPQSQSALQTQQTQQTPQAQQIQQEQDENQVQTEAPKQLPAILPRSASTGGAKTILKPGGFSQNAPVAPKVVNGLTSKPTSEKPTLVAKAPAPVPIKSPWASLPPIDKVPPVAPPVQAPQQTRFARDPHGFESIVPVAATKEIAADDFNRAWGEDQTNRTLFDSKSGRYEPVSDARRPSLRDQGFRQHAVLQRSTLESNSKGGAPEPSAAFQTNRSNGETAWSHRRASSSLSGGSGPVMRRMSTSRPTDGGINSPLERPDQGSLRTRRESSSYLGSATSPSLSVKDVSHPSQDSGLTAQDSRLYASPSSAKWSRPGATTAHNPHANGSLPAQSGAELGHQVGQRQNSHGESTGGQPGESPAMRQQRLMREKIERARQAKSKQIEEEKRESEARAERLRVKMASLKQATPEAQPQDDVVKPANEVDASAPVSVVKPTEDRISSPVTQSSRPAAEDASSKSLMQSPPKPPQPSHNGQVTQYGLIKLHQPQAVKKPYSGHATTHITSEPSQALQPNATQVMLQPPVVPNVVTSPQRSQQKPFASSNQQVNSPPGLPAADQADPSRARAWQQVATRFGTVPNDSGNIWGSSFGGLGNGVLFGQNKAQTGAEDKPASSANQEAHSNSIPSAPNVATNRPVTSDDLRKIQEQNIRDPRLDRMFKGHNAEQIERERFTSNNVAFPQNRTEANAVNVEGAASSTLRPGYPQRVAWGLPWPRESNSEPQPFSNLNHKTTETTQVFAGQDDRSIDMDKRQTRLTSELPQVTRASQPRLSRFYGVDRRLQADDLSLLVGGPPPEALSYASRPQFSYPNVKLPPPKPVVKLPATVAGGAAMMQHAYNMQTVSFNKTSSLPHQPLAQQPEIMSKLNNLLRKPSDLDGANSFRDSHSSWKTSSLNKRIRLSPVPPVIFSKVAIQAEQAWPVRPRVNIPRTVEISALNGSKVAITKETNVTKSRAEDDFLEDREFGSVPKVRLPKMASVGVRMAQTNVRFTNSRFGRPSVDAVTINTAASPVEVLPTLNGASITINILGMKTSKSVAMPFTPTRAKDGVRTFSGPQRDSRGGRRQFSQSARRGMETPRGTGRTASASPMSNAGSPQSAQKTPTAQRSPRFIRGGASGGRGRGIVPSSITAKSTA